MRITRLLVLLCLFGFATFGKSEKNILDYFREIDHPLLDKSLAGPASEEPERPVGKDEVLKRRLKNPEGKNIKLTVDIPNFFIEIRQEPRAGTEYRQYAIYSPEKDPIFAISRKYLAYDTNFIAFLAQKNGVWSDVTSETFPKIDLDLFAETPADLRERQKLLRFGTFSYSLPRHGTTITVQFEVDSFRWVENGISENISSTTNQHEAQLKALLRPLTYRTVLFKWDKAHRRFHVSKKIKR